MSAETAFLKQWHEAKTKAKPEPTRERPVGRFDAAMSLKDLEARLGDVPKLFRIVDDAFFPLLEQFDSGELEIEYYAGEIEILKGYLTEQLIGAKYPQAMINGVLALLDVPTVILSQVANDRRRRDRPDLRFHHLSNEERESVYFMSTWQQQVADYFIGFGEKDLDDPQAKMVHDLFVKQWRDYTKDAKGVIQKLDPTITDREFAVANDFNGYKQGIWGSVGVVLDLFHHGYEVRWSDPKTDVLRKIDMIAARPGDTTLLGISCKTWSNLDGHVVIREQADLEHAPGHRRDQLVKEWQGLSSGAVAFGRETKSTVKPVITAIAARQQNPYSGRLYFQRDREALL